MAPRAVPLLLGLLLLVPFGAGQSDEADGAVPEALYFIEGSDWLEDQRFTSHPPSPEAAGSEVRFSSEGTYALLVWRLEPLPVTWNLTDGDSAVTLYLSGLDDVLPIPSSDPSRGDAPSVDQAGRLRIIVSVIDRAGTLLLQGQSLFEPDLLQPRAEVFEIAFGLDVVEAADVDRLVTISIEVSGRNRDLTNISPVHLHAGTATYPSHIQLDGFPYAAYRVWEAEAREEYERNVDTLRGSPSPEPSPTTTNGTNDPQGIPGPGVVWTLLSLSVLAISAMLERERPRPRRP